MSEILRRLFKGPGRNDLLACFGPVENIFYQCISA